MILNLYLKNRGKNKIIKDTIGNIFDFISETNLIEEDFYNNMGEYPVFSGQTEKEGIVAYIDTYNQNKPCITFTTYGQKAGKIYYREGKYTIGRNCMGLCPKEKYNDKINLRWFSYKFQNLFHRLRIGELKGQRSLNRMLLENIEISIPDIQIQKKQLATYFKVQYFLDAIIKLLKRYDDFLKSNLIITKYVYKEEIREFFHIKGGNSRLTEEFIYYNPPNDEKENIPILSGATLEINLMGYLSKNAKPNNRNLKIFSSPSILVVRKGIAGHMTFINKGEFTINDDAYVLILKKKWMNKINLRWFIYQYQELFYKLVTSKSDNATFNKEYIEKQKVKIPKFDIQKDIGNNLLKIDSLNDKLKEIKRQLKELLETEIL